MRSLLFPPLFVILTLTAFQSCSGPHYKTPQESYQAAWSFYQKGIDLKKAHQYEKAERFLEKAIKTDPTMIVSYLELADILISMGNNTRAEQCLQQIPVQVARESRFYYLLGSAQFNQSKINESVQNLEQCLKTDSSNRDASWKLARLYFRLENYSHALEHLEPLTRDTLNADQQKIQALFQKIHSLLKTNDTRTEYERQLEFKISASEKTTRGMLACILLIELGSHNKSGYIDITFKDVSATDSHAVYYQKAVGEHYLEKLPDGKFYPNYPIKRRNLAHYLNEIVKQYGNISSRIVPGSVMDVPLGDLQFEAIRNVYQWDLMALRDENKFFPDDPVTGKELINSIKNLKKMIRPD